MAVLPESLMPGLVQLSWAAQLLAQGVAGADPLDPWDLLRRDVIPVAAAYLVFLGLLITYRVTIGTRSPRSGPREERQSGGVPRWGDLIRHLAGTAVGGYAFFLLIVVVFYFSLGGEELEFIRQALFEGSILTFALVLPAFLLFAFLDDLRSRRRTSQH
jgi:hypothetical protein